MGSLASRHALLLATSAAFLAAPLSLETAALQGGRASGPPRVVAWNDLGMHCIDPDFSVFAILPPFNTVNVQFLRNGLLERSGAGLTVTFEALADATGSINSTSIGKTNFWDHEDDLFGVQLPPDTGLAGNSMPGLANVPQPLTFDSAWNWFEAEGVPFTPIDDALAKNPYPLVRVRVKDAAGTELASTITVVPNSEELECSECHASGASPFARPAGGWVFDADPLKDDRLNILRLHDERQQGDPTFAAALATLGFNPSGLEATVRVDDHAVLCDACHGSNALPGTGLPGISPMTEAIHGLHGTVQNAQGQLLEGLTKRAACYSCHPGRETQCLRGAMGRAIGADGEFSMNCQSCHGSFSSVGATGRVGWLEEPTCQNCHTGSATNNSGAIRFTSAFDATGSLRQPASNLFATTPDTPATGFSLYRFSTGHGELQCSACHGPPHAIYPTSFANDNVQNLALQGHQGTLVDCNVCHTNLEDNQIDGPHGMHPVTAKWVKDQHGDEAEHNLSSCRACHGANDRGTVLSRAQGPRSYSTKFGARSFWRGFRVSCYECHNGPSGENHTTNRSPSVPDLTLSTPNDAPLPIQLTGTDPDGNSLTFRIVSQPAEGTVGLVGATATYLPKAGYVGTTSFTYAAWDGKSNSNLGTVTLTSTTALCQGTTEAYGFGCAGEGGFLPTLSLQGCPSPGQTVTFQGAGFRSGTFAFLVAGSSRVYLELNPTCALRVFPILEIAGPFPTGGGGTGQGTFRYAFAVPPSLGPTTVDLQAFALDTAAAGGLSASNGLEVDFR